MSYPIQPLGPFLAKMQRYRENELIPRVSIAELRTEPIPPRHSLDETAPIAMNQGSLGSCSACAIRAAIMAADETKSFEPSVLYIYTKELLYDNPNQPIKDLGSIPSHGMLIINQSGCASNALMPYTLNDQLFPIHFGELPSAACEADAAKHLFPLFKDITHNGSLEQAIWLPLALDFRWLRLLLCTPRS